MMRPAGEKPTLLLLGYGDRSAALSGRVLLLQFRALQAEGVEQAVTMIRAASEPVRAVLVPVPPPFEDPAQDVARLREAGAGQGLQLVAVGPRPDAEGVDRLRKAGLRFACFEPWTDSELRFILNRAIYDPARARIKVRDGLRVPTNLMGRVFGQSGEKPVLVYNISVGGAYLETHRPSPVGALVDVELPLDPGALRLKARVISTNVPGNLRRPNLPLGMGVRFEQDDPATTETLERYVADRARQFEL
jgi:hypothetical protein